jgi:hypothetical protein
MGFLTCFLLVHCVFGFVRFLPEGRGFHSISVLKVVIFLPFCFLFLFDFLRNGFVDESMTE